MIPMTITMKARRDFKITKQLVKKYGETDGCPGCKCATMKNAPRREHTQAGRKKMEQTMAGDPKLAEILGTRDRRHGLVPENFHAHPRPRRSTRLAFSEPYAAAVNMITVCC